MFNNKIEGMNMPAPKQNFGIKDTTAVECPECKNTVFQNGVIFRKVARFLLEPTKTLWFLSQFHTVSTVWNHCKTYFLLN